MKPFRLTPRPVPRVWGGDALHRMGRCSEAAQPIGESWEVHGDLLVRDGDGAGQTLDQLCRRHGQQLLGRWCTQPDDGFPLLIKWLDCQDWLSIQVHPDDAVARRLDNQPRGKSEAWMFWEVRPGAEVIHGWSQRPADIESVRGQQWLDFVGRWTPDPKSWAYTPPGTVHALGPGLVVFEVQQSSDLTYRLYDWGRVGLDGLPRELHEEKGQIAIRDSLAGTVPQGSLASLGQVTVHSPYFTVESVQGGREWSPDGDSFELLTALSDDVSLEFGCESLPLPAFDTVILPAQCEPVRCTGSDWLRVRLAGPAGRNQPVLP